ncbi:MAG TPA: hypothetical protein VFR58_14945 [Flavisolibacter sp.]|nr:hypothetical protein [Flavisolibacter sp.]
MKKRILACCLALVTFAGFAQEEEQEKRFFKKENLFTGGSISLGISNQSFLIGGNPVFGYSLTRWADIGLVGNYNYTSFRDYNFIGDKLRQSVYGGGAFTRLFPVRFLFAQAQVERNWIQLKYLPANNGASVKSRVSANSVLLGAGYSTGRDPEGRSAWGYLAVMVDVTKNTNSPYVDSRNRSLPIIRAGVNIPLFRGDEDR